MSGRKGGKRGRNNRKNKGRSNNSKRNAKKNSNKNSNNSNESSNNNKSSATRDERINQPQKKKNQKNIKIAAPNEIPEVFVGIDIGTSFIKIATVAQSSSKYDLSNFSSLSAILGTNATQKNGNDPADNKINENENENKNKNENGNENDTNTISNSSMNQLFHSRINFVADDTGHRLIPSVITILDSNHNEVLIGTEAVKSSVRNYKNCIYFSKHLMPFSCNSNSNANGIADMDMDMDMQSQYQQWKKSATKFGTHKSIVRPNFESTEQSPSPESPDDILNENEQKTDTKTADNQSKHNSKKKCLIKYKLKNANNNNFMEFKLDYSFTLLLKKVFNVISSQTGSDKINVVTCVPSHYGQADIDEYRHLLMKAGFKPLQIMYDYSSAIIACNLDIASPMPMPVSTNPLRTVLCIDFGTFVSQFVVLKIKNGIIVSDDTRDAIYKKYDCNINGVMLDECMLEYFIKEFQRKNRGCFIEIEDCKQRLKILTEIHRVKHVFSSGANEVFFDIESLQDDIDFHFKISKSRFESIIYDQTRSIMNWITQQTQSYQQYAQQSSKCSDNNSVFDHVVISGGLAMIPKLQQLLENMFGPKLMNAQLTEKGITSNFIHTYGCAIQALSLSYMNEFQLQFQKGKHAQQMQCLTNVLNIPKNNNSNAMNSESKSNCNTDNKSNHNNNNSKNKQKSNKKSSSSNNNSGNVTNTLTKAFVKEMAKNKFLMRNMNICLSAHRIRISYCFVVETLQDHQNQEQPICLITRGHLLPFQTKLVIDENELIALANNGQSITTNLNVGLMFRCEVIFDDGENEEKEATMLEKVVNINIKAKKQTKSLDIVLCLNGNALNITVLNNNNNKNHHRLVFDIINSIGKQPLSEDNHSNNDGREADDNTIDID